MQREVWTCGLCQTLYVASKKCGPVGRGETAYPVCSKKYRPVVGGVDSRK